VSCIADILSTSCGRDDECGLLLNLQVNFSLAVRVGVFADSISGTIDTKVISWRAENRNFP